LKIESVDGIDSVLSLDSKIEIKFNTSLGVKTISKAIKCSSGKEKAIFYYSYAKKEDGDLVMLTPYYSLLPYLKYNCKISTDLTDLYGVHLENEYNFSFKTSDTIFSGKEFKKENYSFSLVKRVIDTKCSYCHNEDNDINFKISNLEEFLIDNYVTPNSPRESFLVRKLLGINFNGKKMPLNGSLTIRDIDKFFGWIKNIEEN